MSAFANFQAALPYAFALGRKLARKYPLSLDVDSVVMEALWKAQLAGNTFTRAYVFIRVNGALKDEARRLAEGQRGNYQDVGAFLDASEVFSLASESADPVDRIDRERRLAERTPGGRYLVDRIAKGDNLAEIARDRLVSPARVGQVVARLAANPRSVTRLPGPAVDLYAELRAFAKAEVRRLAAGATSCRALARALGGERSAYNWATGVVSLPRSRGKRLQPSPVRDAVRQRALTLVAGALERAEGHLPTAARLLTVGTMTAHRWRRLLPTEQQLSRDTRRPDIADRSIVELRSRGLSHRAIARQLGCTKDTVARRLSRAKGPAKCKAAP